MKKENSIQNEGWETPKTTGKGDFECANQMRKSQNQDYKKKIEFIISH